MVRPLLPAPNTSPPSGGFFVGNRMILDATGRKIKAPRQKETQAVVFVSTDGETWEPVMAYDVPECVKAPDVMAMMLNGEVIETTQRKYYMANRAI